MERRTDGQKDKRDGRTRGHVCLWCVVCLFVCLFVRSFVCSFLVVVVFVVVVVVVVVFVVVVFVFVFVVVVVVVVVVVDNKQTRFGSVHNTTACMFFSVLFCSVLFFLCVCVCVCVCVVFLFRFFVREIVSRLQRALQTNTLGIVHTEADPA